MTLVVNQSTGQEVVDAINNLESTVEGFGSGFNYEVGTGANELPRNVDLGTAAQVDTSVLATAAQGTLADSATQPEDLGTAALADTGTASGNVPLNSDLGNSSLDDKTSSGAVLWDDGNYQPEVSLGLGVVRVMKNNSGSTISNNAIVAGSSLNAVFFDDLGALTQSSSTGAGTWKNVGGANCSDGNSREFVRIT
jgi:hypothetical protein